MALQADPWDSYENHMTNEEKITAKRKYLRLVKAGKLPYRTDKDLGPLFNHADVLPAQKKRVGSEVEEDFMVTDTCAVCNKECLMQIENPVCNDCDRETRLSLKFDDKSWYAKVRPIEDTKTKCPAKKYGVVSGVIITDELGFRRAVGKQSLLTHYVTHQEEEMANLLDGLCGECFTKIWAENTCHICTKESSEQNSDLCKQCQKENPNYDPRESPLKQKLQPNVVNSDLHESLQKRKEFNKLADEKEVKFLKSQRKKKNSKKSKEVKQ
jgi:hypothetical protein